MPAGLVSPFHLVVPVRALRDLTPRIRLLTLDAGATAFAFRAGQAVWLRRLGHDARKPYSIASAPSDLTTAGSLDFLVGLDDPASSGDHLLNLEQGASVEIEGPMGGFDLPPSIPSAPVLLVAGGTGIAPLRSMWRELLAHPEASSLSIVHSARSVQELAFLQELRDLEREGRIRLDVTITGPEAVWSGSRGRVTGHLLAAHVSDPLATRCAICGPAAFVASVSQALAVLGVPPAHVATERWTGTWATCP